MKKESLSGLLQDIGEKATKAAKEALNNGADMVVDDAKSRCPVKTGALKESIHKEVNRNGTKIKVLADATNENGVYYGKIVEFSPKINEPFLYPALDALRNTIRENIAKAVQESLKR
ncbi:HK97-gp10 family putative phage morphogenesis protein [uncultured Anaerovibrio sp.]|uniref:HK97-gp10 family putative phage morphogenesis protein n=1 Tax=uncultured Anaerovibrio sp. TaxID=361586 RepID=UPI00261B88AC|nr:HK97-gp10 family putative phage morphogenesis protein [uncultured Anaerovibrio sp.]